ncbi:unnamed protein product [Oncorhynchus mykiss]|uniref:Uncharacterized protein n=1 Tax=Oncorhynchus mykiss TaxID=8022 RepID=A0A060XBZ6_ONCMY|nr:unnamed protein product [Oncorhynchus mykiss]
MALSVCFVFTITIGIFPAVTVDVRSTMADGGAWDTYFIPVSCFLLFNVMDWAGRSLTAVCMWVSLEALSTSSTDTVSNRQRLVGVDSYSTSVLP